MKCIAYKKQYERAKNKLNEKNIREVVRFMTAATSELMLERFKWSQDRLVEYLQAVWQNFNMTNTPLADMDSFDPGYNFDYRVKTKQSTVRTEVSEFTKSIDAYRDQAVRWFIDVLVYTLKDRYEWADSTTDRFVRGLDPYLKALREKTLTADMMIEKLKAEYQLDLRMHVI